MQLQFSPVELVLLIVCSVTFLVQVWFLFFVHRKLLIHANDAIEGDEDQGISVIIAARNELANLEQFLPLILAQQHPNFEVVVVNDRSWDGTADLLKTMAETHLNLRIVTIAEGEKFIAGKKFAVSMGIKAAKFDWLVFTDADCAPASTHWLTAMQPPHKKETEILLGYSPYYKRFGLLNALIRFETFFTAINYLSFALNKNAYMGVGRNLAYRKSLFFKSKGFAAHMHVPSGDDDLFVNANATPENTAIVLRPDAYVWSLPKETWRTYFRQKRRHAGAGKLYKRGHKTVLTLQIVAQFLFYATLIALFFFRSGIYPASVLLFLSLMGRAFVYLPLLKRLDHPDLRWSYFFLDILLYFFLMLNGVVSIFVKKSSWK